MKVPCPPKRALTCIALEDGYLERLFLKESKEQGAHFDDPKSTAKIVPSPPQNPPFQNLTSFFPTPYFVFTSYTGLTPAATLYYDVQDYDA
jgi:hypothetical protein